MKHFSSDELVSHAKALVAEERKVTVALIETLEEISRRLLYSTLGYASIWEFATKELGLSEGAAQRRIQAMRLVRDVPEAKASLEDGRLSLSNAAKVQSFRQAERKLGRKSDAKALVAQVEMLSQRECEMALFAISPEAMPQERERIVSAEGDRELTLVISPGLREKLQQIRGLIAHAKPETTYAELLHYMADETLAHLKKKKGLDLDAATASTAAAAVEERRELPAGERVALPQAVQRAAWSRGEGQCEVEHRGRRCTSRYRIQIDHIVPLALGGTNALANLRLACFHHNQEQARTKLGRAHVPIRRACA